MAYDVTGQIKAKHDAAEKARRLANYLSTDDDKARLRSFADELEADADALERTVARPGTPSDAVAQTQVQMQQQADRTDPEERKTS